MPSDLNKPLIRLTPKAFGPRQMGRQGFVPPARPYTRDRQVEKIGPKFNRLSEVLARDTSGVELTRDPTGLAPERLLVFEVLGPVQNFANAIAKVTGLELIGEDDLDDDPNAKPVAYLLMPDMRALREMEKMWRRWEKNLPMNEGFTPWRDVFATLRTLRPWGPQDRVQDSDVNFLHEEIDVYGDELIPLEVELVFRGNPQTGSHNEKAVKLAVENAGGEVVTTSRISDISYHALLVKLPSNAVRSIIERQPSGLAGLEPILFIRPQSVATGIEVSEVEEPTSGSVSVKDLGEPIAAVIDGVPIALHPLLRSHLIVEDPFELEATALVSQRIHGTAMASLLIHGDRNRQENTLPRKIHLVPVLGEGDQFPKNRLVIDLIYLAITNMKRGASASAPHVIIVNLSLGNKRRPFFGQVSAWARLLDRLSFQYGILFIVSAGNVVSAFNVPKFATRTAFEDSNENERTPAILEAIGALRAERKIFSPAESINALTIGASNIDWVSEVDRLQSRGNIDPYTGIIIANPSSALGPGFSNSVKPDILMAGGKERLSVVGNDTSVLVKPAGASRQAGLKVAGPLRTGSGAFETYTSGTSAAAALASRTCHRIHDALEQEYGHEFLALPNHARAVLLKALLVHPARWDYETAELIREVIGPRDNKHHVRQKDNIRRFLGFGNLDAEEAIACTADRATFWAVGSLAANQKCSVSIPIPETYGGKAILHSLSATVAWFTPVAAGRKAYRSVKLKILEPDECSMLAVKGDSDQPDVNQTNRGTVYSRIWWGNGAAIVPQDMHLNLVVQREPDQGTSIDERVQFALATTISMPGVLNIYDQARSMVTSRVQQEQQGKLHF